MTFRIIGFIGLVLLMACNGQEQTGPNPPKVKFEETVQDWSKDAVIYELNTRQFSEDGTFQGVIAQIPRLKELGVKIVWFMPVQPIGELNRKGKLGSYYSIKDYTALNPNYGNAEDFLEVVNTFHKAGIKVILDWVANHTGWDHVWTKNKDWFTLDEDGNFVSPVADWSDVIDLNYDNVEMRKAMIESMKYWIETFGIDGFRCDVAGMVPLDFWQSARNALDSLKPVFMLAEAEGPEFHTHGFDMTYAWEFHHITNQIAKGEMTLQDLIVYSNKEFSQYNEIDYRMVFTTNHDENSWKGTVFDRYGAMLKPMTVLTFTYFGMPLIYSGQEAGLNKKLRFFEKDTIDWQDDLWPGFYKGLINLKKENEALWNGENGARPEIISFDHDNVFAYIRQKNNNIVWAILNFSDSEQKMVINDRDLTGDFKSLFNSGQTLIRLNDTIILAPYGFQIYYSNE
jgi:glycosidase